MTDLSGHVALITGGGRGIGEATAKALAEAGALVAVVARTSGEVERVAYAIDMAGGRAVAFAADVTDRDAMARVCKETAGTLGPVDILINNAAVIGPLGMFSGIDTEAWAQACEINLIAPVQLTRALLPEMLRNGWGRVVNITTGAVNNLTRDDTYNAYLTTKAGLEAHTLNLAAEVAHSGVTVNALRPGIVDTAMQTFIRSQDPGTIGENFHQRFLKRYLDGDLIRPEVPASSILELVRSRRNGEIVSTKSP